MLAILFLILCLVFGVSLMTLLIPDARRLFIACAPSKNITAKLPTILFTLPAGFIIGMMLITISNYALTYGFSLILDKADLVKRIGVLTTFILFTGLIATNISICLKRNDKAGSNKENSLIPDFDFSIPSIIYYGLCTILFTAIASFLMFYTYNIEGGELFAGYSTFSDLAPHTAMTASFGVGFNFPTQYYHFAGDGIQYHFLFYFLCGTLQYLGLPIDLAINLPSIISMVCAFELLGVVSVLFSRKRTAFIIAPMLVLFRSSFNVFYHVNKLIKESGLSFKESISLILHSSEWYGETPYDTWGIWAINVYPNQRHLLLGMSCILIFFILMTPFIRRMCISILKADSFKSKCKAFILTPEAWVQRKNDPLNPLGILALTSILAVIMPFFHGSALIGALLVLFGMAIFSESRLLYLVIACLSVVSSFIQTKLFSGSASNVVKFQHKFGFVVEPSQVTIARGSYVPSIQDVSNYLITVTGLTLIVAFLYALYLLIRDIYRKKPIYRSLLFICILLPLVFAFNFQVSLEMLANHKFIQFTLILCDIFVAGALSELMNLPIKHKDKDLSENDNKGRLPLPAFIAIQTVSIIIAIALIVPLTATGVSEWCTYINLNKNHAIVNTESELTKWIIQNTDESDVFLTPEWSLNRFFLAGRPAYYGWPYYAWSAGHNTNTRESIYYWLISGCNNNPDEFIRYCEERGIKYVVLDPEMIYFNYPSGVYCDTEFFANNLTQVAYFSNENTIVYQVY